MKRAVSLFMFCLGLTLLLATRNLGATPLGLSKGLADAERSGEVTHKVHGCHHYCKSDRSGPHRHGPGCHRRACR
jgi:hypothetical protein